MKIKDVRPCDICGGKIVPDFYKITMDHGVVDPKAVNQFVGLTTMFGGNTALAEVFSPDSDIAKFMGDLTGEGPHQFLVCGECALKHLSKLFGVIESRIDRQDQAETEDNR